MCFFRHKSLPFLIDLLFFFSSLFDHCHLFLFLSSIVQIYFVFISPLLFSESVMIKVATGGNTGEVLPMLLKIPRLNDALGGYSMLGLGDVALPGLFVSFLLRFDYMKRAQSVWRSYCFIATVAYACGLVATYVGLALMRSGQPALLYLVPALLGSTVFVAWRRNEFNELWVGPHIPDSVHILQHGGAYDAERGADAESGSIAESHAADDNSSSPTDAAAAAVEVSASLSTSTSHAEAAEAGDVPLLVREHDDDAT